MKWLLYGIAALLTVVVVAVVVLLAIGSSESRLSASVEVARPADVVFEWISEPQHVKQWLGWLVEIRAVTPQQGQVGARQVWVMEDRNNNNQLMEIQTEYVEYRSPDVLTARLAAAAGFTGTVEYRLHAMGSDRTRLDYVASYHFEHPLARLLEPLITRSAQQKLEDDLARLKQRAESSAGLVTR